MDYFVKAIPFFILLMVLEWGFSLLGRKPLYHFHDSMNNLGCGILSELFGGLGKGAIFAAYLACYRDSFIHFSPDGWGQWVLAFFTVDFAYYLAHRFTHRVNAGWATHAVHHQSEEYNLSVALRQSTFQPLFTWFFFVPLGLLGVSPSVFVATYSINLLYQFWIHTRAIGRLGPLEWVLNTPSHHRVHHGRNPKYIDKNYAGILIVWDRLFGTFQREEEEPLYGVTKPVNSWNPIWANFQVWVETAAAARFFPHFRDKCLIWLMPPGWAPSGMKAPPSPMPQDKPSRIPSRCSAGRESYYVFGQFVASLVLTMVLFNGKETLDREASLILTALVFSGLVFVAGLLELKEWAIRGEPYRLVGHAIAVVYLAAKPSPALASWGAALLAAFYLLCFLGVLLDYGVRHGSFKLS